MQQDWYQKIITLTLFDNEVVDTTRGPAITRIGHHMQFDVTDRLPITSTRKIFWGKAAIELYLFLNGYDEKVIFNTHGCTWWDKEFDKANTNRLGHRYGRAWRDFNKVDQIIYLQNQLRDNRHCRSAFVTSSVKHHISQQNGDLSESCILLWQVNILHNTLVLSVYQRSADIIMGLPYDIIEYAILAKLLANEFKCTQVVLDYHISNAHIYLNQLDVCTIIKNAIPNKQYPKYKCDATIDDFHYSQIYVEPFKSGKALQLELQLKH